MGPGKPRGMEVKSPVRGMIFEHLLFRAWRKRAEYGRGYRYLHLCLSLKLRKSMPRPFSMTIPPSERFVGG